MEDKNWKAFCKNAYKYSGNIVIHKLEGSRPQKQVLIRRDACKLLISMPNHAINTLIKNDTVQGNLIPIKNQKKRLLIFHMLNVLTVEEYKEKIL